MPTVEAKDHWLEWTRKMHDRVQKIKLTTEPGTEDRLHNLVDTYEYGRVLRKALEGKIQFVGFPGVRRRL